MSDLASGQEGVQDGHQAGEEIAPLDDLGRDGRGGQHLQGDVDDGVVGLSVADKVQLSKRGVETSEPQA